LLREVNHADKKYRGHIVKRGQLFRSYKNIQEDLKWKFGYKTQMYTVSQIKNFMRTLRDVGMIITGLPTGLPTGITTGYPKELPLYITRKKKRKKRKIR